MKAIEFPQQNEIIAKNQPEYIPLPAFLNVQPVRFKDGTVGHAVIDLTCCFHLDPEEIAQVIATGKIWYSQVVNGQSMQPIRMSVMNPFTSTMTRPDNWVKQMCDMMRAAIEASGYSEQGKQEIRAFIHDQFSPGRECVGGRIKGVALPGSQNHKILDNAIKEYYDEKSSQANNPIKKCDGNGKR